MVTRVHVSDCGPRRRSGFAAPKQPTTCRKLGGYYSHVQSKIDKLQNRSFTTCAAWAQHRSDSMLAFQRGAGADLSGVEDHTEEAMPPPQTALNYHHLSMGSGVGSQPMGNEPQLAKAFQKQHKLARKGLCLTSQFTARCSFNLK